MTDDNEEKIKRIPIEKLLSEEGADELVNSPNMDRTFDWRLRKCKGPIQQPNWKKSINRCYAR
jgi:hypothetical protein